MFIFQVCKQTSQYNIKIFCVTLQGGLHSYWTIVISYISSILLFDTRKFINPISTQLIENPPCRAFKTCIGVKFA